MKMRLDQGRWGLSARIVALSLALLLLVQAAVFSALRISIGQSARDQIAQELLIGERVWLRLLEQNAQTLAQGAALLAADYGFRAAVSSGDLGTIRSALDNHGARIGATITALLDTRMALRAVAESPGPSALAPHLAQLVSALQLGSHSGQIAVLGGVPYQFVLVPMRAPLLIGWVLMGFPISQKLADDMRALSDVHLALVRRAPDGQDQIIISTLPEDARQRLLEHGADVSELALDGDLLVTRSVKLRAGSSDLRTVLLRSVGEVVEPFRRTEAAHGWITALGVLLFAVGSVFVARRVTTPLRSLVHAAERLGRGKYDVPMQYTARRDEIGGLAKAFDRMRINIDAQQAEIRQLAYWDRLTGLPNRARFRDAVQQAIDQHAMVDGSSRGALAVVLLDLDRFKHVNDVLGYSFGDLLLHAVAKRLQRQVVAPGDMVARLGGDEFAVLLTGCDAAQAMEVARRLAASFELPLAFEDQTVDLSAGFGVACWPIHAADAEVLLSRAEVAMYAAKNQTTVTRLYDPSLDSSSSQTLSLLSELRYAVEHDELCLFLQPKLSLSDATVVAAEALVRWQHPQRGLVLPLEFIPFAEQTGFVRQLTLWMFDRAARLWAGLQTPEQPLRLAINLSTRDLLDPEFPLRLDAILATHGAPAGGFCLEITESAIMDDPQRAQGTLHRLAQRGFKLSIDDFGTGYSSLSYLKRLPVDELKIDKSFVIGMEQDEDDAKIVRSTIDLAHNLGLSVVAEGVENRAVWEQLKALGCDEAQGYFLSKPLTEAGFLQWCQDWSRERACRP